jgi:hypothetical protein
MKLFLRGDLAFGIFSEGGRRRSGERLILRKDCLDLEGEDGREGFGCNA